MIEIAVIICTIWAWRNGWGQRALIAPILYYAIVFAICFNAFVLIGEGKATTDALVLIVLFVFFPLGLFCLGVQIVLLLVKPKSPCKEAFSLRLHVKNPSSEQTDAMKQAPLPDPPPPPKSAEEILKERAEKAAAFRAKLDREMEP